MDDHAHDDDGDDDEKKKKSLDTEVLIKTTQNIVKVMTMMTVKMMIIQQPRKLEK